MSRARRVAKGAHGRGGSPVDVLRGESLPSSAPALLEIPAALLAELEDRARRAAPEECCGILMGRAAGAGEPARVVAAPTAENVWPGDRTRRYEIAPETLLAEHRRAREAGRDVVGYYHSHPGGEAAPSAFDRERAWPGVTYLIVSPARREARAWRLAAEGGGFDELEVVAREEC